MTCIEYKKMIAEMGMALFCSGHREVRDLDENDTVSGNITVSSKTCIVVAKAIAARAGIEEPKCGSKLRKTGDFNPCQVICPCA